jgi:hypothetical protein
LNSSNFRVDENILNKLLNPEDRKDLLDDIFKKLESLSSSEIIELEFLEISTGRIPVITINKLNDLSQIERVFLFTGAQHNEYNGLFGQIAFLSELSANNSIDLLPQNSAIVLFPLMNPYGFLNPRRDNKSGYYLKSGANLNRCWRRTFIPNFVENNEEVDLNPIPENSMAFKYFIQKYWDREIELYIVDFHETSLFRRFSEDMAKNLNAFYKFEHPYQMWTVQYLTKYEDLPKREPLFVKPSQCIDHLHFNLNINQGEKLREDFKKAWEKNKDKLPFYYVFTRKSKDFCKSIAKKVQDNLKDILWDIRKPAHQHVANHGCIVCLGYSTSRPKTYTCELEVDKQFFNLFEEAEKCNSDKAYFTKKLKNINITVEIVKETIKQAISS